MRIAQLSNVSPVERSTEFESCNPAHSYSGMIIDPNSSPRDVDVFNLIQNTMLWTIVAVLLVLWLLGLATHVAGGLIHVLLVIAVIVMLVRIIQGRRPV